MNPIKLITKPFGCLFSLIGSLVGFAVLLFIFGWFLFGAMFSPWAEKRLGEASGLPTRLDASRINVFLANLDLEDLTFGNPEDFPADTMLAVRSVVLDGSYSSLFQEDALAFDEMTIRIDQISAVFDRSGNFNLEPLIALTHQWSESVEGAVLEVFDHKVVVQRVTLVVAAVETGQTLDGTLRTERHNVDYQRTFDAPISPREILHAFAEDMRAEGLNTFSAAILKRTAADRVKEASDSVEDAVGVIRDILNSGE